MESINNFLPNSILEFIKELNINFDNLEEIRLRINQPLILRTSQDEVITDYIVTENDISMTLQLICENSIYTYQNQICGGFITVTGGFRVGITGNAVVEEGKIININYISSMNIRIARQILDASYEILPYILDYENNNVYNTLIVSPPGGGKTTILRDLVRNISNGVNGFRGINVAVIDERGEIAAMTRGISQNDIGIRTDVIDNVSKVLGIRLLVRSMAPQVIVADEIGGEDEINTIIYAISSGVNGIFTAHGESYTDLIINPTLKSLIESNRIERIVFLNEHLIKNIYYFNVRNMRYEKFCMK